MTMALSQQTAIEFIPGEGIAQAQQTENIVTVKINDFLSYQSIHGIGSSLESSTAYNLMRLSSEDRLTVMNRLFGNVDPSDKSDTEDDFGIGMSLMRVTIGTSDFCPPPYYSYDDMSDNETDIGLKNFNINNDETFIIPVILEALQASARSDLADTDQLELFASPWSAPNWMKIGGRLEGGGIKTEFLAEYASYLAKFVDAYKEQGIVISAITPQNEPLSSQSYPSAFFPPEEEAKLIREFLGPLMRERDCEIWCFDHNWDTTFYPETILNDTSVSGAAQYVSGSAWHGYVGKPEQMSNVHALYPDKGIYFTEMSTYGVVGAHTIVQIFRNWARSYNAWVTMLDTNLQPNSGPFTADPTMIQLDAEKLHVLYNVDFYLYGQFSKYIRRGAIRISSEIVNGGRGQRLKHEEEEEEIRDRVWGEGEQPETILDTEAFPPIIESFSHVAFRNNLTSSGRDDLVVVLVNSATDKLPVRLLWGGMEATAVLPANSVSTLRWNPCTQ